jgi:ribosomal protein S27E
MPSSHSFVRRRLQKELSMPNATFLIHECPICGRKLQVRVEYLGSRVTCVHCNGTFVVSQGSPSSREPSRLTLLERAEHLLAADTRSLRERTA